MSFLTRLPALLLCTALAGCLGPSSEQQTSTTSPANRVAVTSTLMAEPGTDRVRLHWLAVPGAYGYYLYHATSPGFDPATAERITVYDSTSTEQTGLVPGSEHYYRISALSDAGEGALSDELHVVLALSIPARDDAAAY